MRNIRYSIIVFFFLLFGLPVLGSPFIEKVILSQNADLSSSLIGANKIYVFQYEYDLKGKTVRIGNNSVLQFQGGCLKNGVVEGNDTYIEAAPVKIFNKDIRFVGTFKNQFLYTEWFGAVGNDKSKARENTDAFNAAINAAIGTNSNKLEEALNSINCISLLNTRYYINGTINVPAAYFKITANSITPIGYVNHRMPIIEQLASTPVITFKDRLIDQNYYGQQLTHVVLENFKIYGSGVKSSLYGVGKEGCSSFNSCEFKNLLILGCRYGFYFDLTEKAGVYNNYFENVTGRENVLGLYINTAASNTNWMNVNTFSRCWFVNNRNCGIVIGRMMNQSFTNLFETCTFESNGEEYNIDDYKLYGASGVTLKGSQAEFHNCYFEANYASRKSNGGLKKGEKIFKEGGVGENLNYGSHIEPMSLNDYEGNLVLGQGQVRLNGCSISASHRLITCGSLSPQLEIHGCNISNSRLNSKTTDAIVVYLLDSNGNKSAVDLKISDLYKKSAGLTKQIKYAYRIEGQLNAKFSKRFSTLSDIDIDVSALESIIVPIEKNQSGKLDDNTAIYIDNINGNDRNTGTNPANALKTLSLINDIATISNNMSLHVVFTNNYEVKESADLVNSGIAQLYFSSLDSSMPVSIALKSTMIGKLSDYGDRKISFRNINFKCDSPIADTSIADMSLIFDNCSIDINKGAFIKCTEGKQVVYFERCNFNSGSRSTLSGVCITQKSGKGELNTHMTDCHNMRNLSYDR